MIKVNMIKVDGYRVVKGKYRTKYLVQEYPDFSRILWRDGEIENISDKNMITAGRRGFNLLIDLLRLSGIKTDARIEYGNLKSQECRVNYDRAKLATLSGEMALESQYDEGVYITYRSFLLPRKSSDVSQMPLKAQKLSDEIGRYVNEFIYDKRLNCRYSPCVEIRASVEKDIATEIRGAERYDIIGEFTRLDQYATLLGKVDRMVLRDFGRNITQKEL